jgi:hypothetical protein
LPGRIGRRQSARRFPGAASCKPDESNGNHTSPEPVNAYREDLQTFQAVSDELTDYRQALDEFLKDRV